ncbi:hypothetical protein FQN50_006238 [Emmonsiellopsis sp. PD_5]|nr:hypothetical protein FQN50_006238 [Emmonsiellopsis sp. PD_5]
MASIASSTGQRPEVSYQQLESGQGQINDPQQRKRNYRGDFWKKDSQEYLRPILWYLSTDGCLLESPAMTVTEGFADFSSAIASPQTDGLQVCTIATKCNILEKKLRIINAYQGLSDIQESIVTTLAEQWEIGRKIIHDLLTTKPCATPLWRIHLPSDNACAGQPKNAQSSPRAYCLSAEDFYLELEWPRYFPEYVNDLFVYVWQPFSKHPELEYAKIRLFGTPEARQAIVILKSDTVLCRLRDSYGSSTRGCDYSGWTPADRVMQYLILIFGELRLDAVDLINNTSSFLEYMTYEGRRKPSTGKLQYLLHLSDYQQSGVDCCQKAMFTISNLSESFSRPLTSVETLQLGLLEEIRQDLNYLQTEFENTKEKVLDLRQALKGQLDLTQMHRTYLLTLLVGLYVPISFVSTYFGMNITDQSSNSMYTRGKISSNDAQGLSNQTSLLPGLNATSQVANSSVPNLMHFLGPQNISMITFQRGAQTWDLDSFWKASIPLAVGTIFLPLIVGSLVRCYTLTCEILVIRGYFQLPMIIPPLLVVVWQAYLARRKRRSVLYYWIALTVFTILQGALGLYVFITARRKGVGYWIWVSSYFVWAISILAMWYMKREYFSGWDEVSDKRKGKQSGR